MASDWSVFRDSIKYGSTRIVALFAESATCLFPGALPVHPAKSGPAGAAAGLDPGFNSSTVADTACRATA